MDKPKTEDVLFVLGVFMVVFSIAYGSYAKAFYDFPSTVWIRVGDDGFLFGADPRFESRGTWVFYQGPVYRQTGAVNYTDKVDLRLMLPSNIYGNGKCLDIEIERNVVFVIGSYEYQVSKFNSTHIKLVKVP